MLPRRIHVHYNGFAERWDEWIKTPNTDRLAELGTRSRNKTGPTTYGANAAFLLQESSNMKKQETDLLDKISKVDETLRQVVIGTEQFLSASHKEKQAQRQQQRADLIAQLQRILDSARIVEETNAESLDAVCPVSWLCHCPAVVCCFAIHHVSPSDQTWCCRVHGCISHETGLISNSMP
jgi:hypothetical protein